VVEKLFLQPWKSIDFLLPPWKTCFLQPWKLIFTTVEIDFFFTTLEIDFTTIENT